MMPWAKRFGFMNTKSLVEPSNGIFEIIVALVAVLLLIGALVPLVQCPVCNGDGVDPPDGVGSTHEPCVTCKESGHVVFFRYCRLLAVR
jgi:hypothetical protein